MNYRIYKIDIEKFYESVSVAHFLEKIRLNVGFPRDAYRLLKSFFNCTNQQGISSLPRGIAISAAIAECLMNDFDDEIRRRPEVFYYARFVDDIVILTDGKENPNAFFSNLREYLAPGLKFNYSKSRFIDFFDTAKGAGEIIAGEFDFLGYKFSIAERRKVDRKISRKVYLDISERKVKRTKTRILRAFKTYTQEKNYQNLLDRLKILSGNYNIFDKSKAKWRNAGLYCNYRLIDVERSTALQELDQFLQKIAFAKRGMLLSTLSVLLPAPQARKLLKISFLNSYKNRTFHHFSQGRLGKLLACWTYA